jgi:nucleoside 2-deoxyribosyltransferase
MSYRVYISYSSKDSELMKDLAQRLKEAGVEASAVNYEKEADGAPSDWREDIRKRVESSNEVVVLLTDNSAHSGWVRYEMGLADAMDKPMTPVVVNDGVERLVPMAEKRFVKYADLPKYLSSLKSRSKAA